MTKTFNGIELAKIKVIVDNSYTDNTGQVNSDGYYIKIAEDISGPGEIDAGKTRNLSLTLDQAKESQDGRTFTWTIHNLDAGTEDAPVNYTITEYNYLHDEYADTLVTAKVNGTPETTIEIDRDSKSAGIKKITFRTDASDRVELTNYYTNTFDLKLRKVDSDV